jgi:hypothetical protein
MFTKDQPNHTTFHTETETKELPGGEDGRTIGDGIELGGGTQPIYEDDQDGVVLTFEAPIIFLLAELVFEIRSWFDTRYLTREPLRPTVLH